MKVKVFMPLLLCQYPKLGGFGERSFQPSLSESGLVFLEKGISITGFELQVQTTPNVQKQNAKMSVILLIIRQFLQDL